MLYKEALDFESVDKIICIPMKTTEQYFPVLLLFMLYTLGTILMKC